MSTTTDVEAGLWLATCWWLWFERSALLQPELRLWSHVARIKHLHLVILTQQNGSWGRHTTQRHLGPLWVSNKPCEIRQRQYSVTLQAGLWSTSGLRPTAVVQNGAKWMAHFCGTSTLTVIAFVLCVTVCCRHFCHDFTLQTSRPLSAESSLFTLFLVFGRAGECYLRVLLPWELWRDAALQPQPHS